LRETSSHAALTVAPGYEKHADHSHVGWITGDDRGAGQSAVGVIDPETVAHVEKEGPLGFLGLPPTVERELQTGTQIVLGQSTHPGSSPSVTLATRTRVGRRSDVVARDGSDT
jgi:hypothetical protein